MKMGCNRSITSCHNSFSIQISLIIFGYMNSEFDFMNQIISCCSDMAMDNILKSLQNYIKDTKHIDADLTIDPRNLRLQKLQSLLLKTKGLYLFWYTSNCNAKSTDKFKVCEQILKLWGCMLTYMRNDAVFSIFALMKVHKLCLDSLDVTNSHGLFCVLIEETKRLSMDHKNESDTDCILHDLKELKYCTLLLNIHNQWNENDMDRIGYLIEALRHLIDMQCTALNRILFGLQSDEDKTYPLFLYSICKLIGKWNTFSIEDIENVLHILNVAMDDEVWRLAFSLTANKENDKKRVIQILFKEWASIISEECDDEEKQKLKALMAMIFNKIGKHLQVNEATEK